MAICLTVSENASWSRLKMSEHLRLIIILLIIDKTQEFSYTRRRCESFAFGSF